MFLLPEFNDSLSKTAWFIFCMKKSIDDIEVTLDDIFQFSNDNSYLRYRMCQ